MFLSDLVIVVNHSLLQGSVGEQLHCLVSGIVDDRPDLLYWASPPDYNPGFDLQARLPGSERYQFFLLFIRFY